MPRAQRTKSAVHEALQRRADERPGASFSVELDAPPETSASTSSYMPWRFALATSLHRQGQHVAPSVRSSDEFSAALATRRSLVCSAPTTHLPGAIRRCDGFSNLTSSLLAPRIAAPIASLFRHIGC
jgi:hypothetical protein